MISNIKINWKLILRVLYFVLVTATPLFFGIVLASPTATNLIKDINPSGDSNPNWLTRDGNSIYFTANDSINGIELWASDGTVSGTNMIFDIDPNGSASPDFLNSLNGTLFFGAADGPQGSEFHGRELWKSDGTVSGTVLVKDINTNGSSSPFGLTIISGTLYLNAFDDSHGAELWKSDGSFTGTILVKDIYTGTDSSNPRFFTDVNGNAFFSANDGLVGEELWFSDGTNAGTNLVKDINPIGDATPQDLTAFNNVLIFSASNSSGREIWKSDGTYSGTSMIKDINPGSANSTPKRFTEVKGQLFFTANDGIHGEELWVSDGTLAGTTLFKDINPGGGPSSPRLLTEIDGSLYFSAFDPDHQRELWISDGTTSGTLMLKEIDPSGSAIIINLSQVQNRLFFSADDGINGIELWKSNGTPEGTFMVEDINPAGNSDPNSLTEDAQTLFFAADDGTNGKELWALDLTNSPPTVNVGGPFTGEEGIPLTITATASDPDEPYLKISWFSDSPLCHFTNPDDLITAIVCIDDETTTSTLLVEDWWGEVVTGTTTITVSNLPPMIDQISGAPQPYQVNRPLDLTIAYSDSGLLDTHSGEIDWGDGNVESGFFDQVANTMSGSHLFTVSDDYTITITLEDDDEGITEEVMVVHINSVDFLPIIQH